MMASAKALLSKRSNVGFNMPAPAFLLGVPPSNAQLSGVETEGQTTMGAPRPSQMGSLDCNPNALLGLP